MGSLSASILTVCAEASETRQGFSPWEVRLARERNGHGGEMRGNVVLVPSDGLQMVEAGETHAGQRIRVRGPLRIQFLFEKGSPPDIRISPREGLWHPLACGGSGSEKNIAPALREPQI